jgi:hypothetical protein
MKRKVPEVTRSQYAIQAIDALFDRPIFSFSTFASCSQIPSPSAKRMIAALKEGGIIRDLTAGKGRRGAIMTFPDLFRITEPDSFVDHK